MSGNNDLFPKKNSDYVVPSRCSVHGREHQFVVPLQWREEQNRVSDNAGYAKDHVLKTATIIGCACGEQKHNDA